MSDPENDPRWQVFDETWADAPSAVPPCPSWCTEDAGHEYDSYDPTLDEFVRNHLRDCGPGAEVAQEERNRCGIAELKSVVVYLHGGDGADVDAAEARRRAAALLNAADMLDAIGGLAHAR